MPNRLCPDCGQGLPAGAPAGMCPNCLLRLALIGAAAPDGGPALPDGTTQREPASPAPAEAPGARIGRYKLLEPIGEGGFGTVWMAEQTEPVRRRVALKIIKLGMDTREVVARFEAERQALALMDHPNIARVFDGGATENGRPYFVMELVKGVRLTDFCDGRRLSTADRLRLFIEVCQAVQHAHQKGVIHRDLKPTNVLVTEVDGRPVPKVIDFGIAKATGAQLTDKTLFTRLNQVIGTPAYMSPEQAGLGSLDIDTRSDVYALGVMLYELLTGRTPFSEEELLKAGWDEVLRTIREKEPPKPSTRLSTLAHEELAATAARRALAPGKFSRLVKGELDWIVMKCLEKDRGRRYETASSLARDLECYLGQEPVTAAAPGIGYRVVKFARRYRAGLAVASAFALLLVAATAISLDQAIRARAAKQRAEHEAGRAIGAERLAQSRLVEVGAERDAKERARQEAESVASFLVNVFQSPDPTRSGRTVTVAESLDRATRELALEMTNQPERRVRLEETIADTYFGLGLYRESIPLLEAARNFYTTNSGPTHANTLTAVHQLANAFCRVGRWEEALKLQEDVLANRQRVNGPEHADTLSAMHNLAYSYWNLNRAAEALPMQQQLLALRRKVNGLDHIDTLRAMSTLAMSMEDLGRHEEAQQLRDEVLSAHRRLRGPEHPETLFAMESVGLSLSRSGRMEEALRLRETSVPLFRKVLGLEHSDTLNAMHNLANSYEDAGRLTEARALREEVLALRRKVNGPDHKETLAAMHNLAISYLNASRFDEAIRLWEEAVPIFRRVAGPAHPNTVSVISRLAKAYERVRNLPAAERLHREEYEIQSRRFPATNEAAVSAAVTLAGCLLDWAWLEHERGSNATALPHALEAESLLHSSRDTRRKTLRSSSKRLIATDSMLTEARTAVVILDPGLTASDRNERFLEAETSLLQCHAGLAGQAGEPGKALPENAARLIRLYSAWNKVAPASGKADQAAQWRKRLELMRQRIASPP